MVQHLYNCVFSIYLASQSYFIHAIHVPIDAEMYVEAGRQLIG